MSGSELKSKGAERLRAAGFKPLPRWWVKAEDLDLIYYMVKQYADEVNRIRAGRTLTPEEEREQAWRLHNQLREGGT